jgi:glycerol uptake facilitator-like aquaporin
MNNKNYFLVAAFASFVLSVSIWFLGDQSVAQQQGIFVGLWVPSILTLGTYFCPACDKPSKEWPVVKDN